MNTERLSHSSSVNEIAEQPVGTHEELEEKLMQETRQIRMQAQVQASQIIADAQATAQDQVDAMVRVTNAASEEAQKVVQSSREKAAIIMAESRREAEQLLEDTHRRLEDHIRKELKGSVGELLTYMSDVVKKVQKLNVSLEQWEIAVPPAVDSTTGNGSSQEEILGLKAISANKQGTPTSRMLTVTDVADLLNVHPTSVRRWANQGLFACYRVGNRGDRRFRIQDVNEFLELKLRKHPSGREVHG